MARNYSFKDYNKENMARAVGRSLPISFKQSIEICSFIRNRKVNRAKTILSEAIKTERPIPFKRFDGDVGHKKNIAAGRFPKRASEEILSLINSAEANAQFKGLNTSNLVITCISANKAPTTTRYGRKRSRNAKRTHIEIVVQEKIDKKETQPEKSKVKDTKGKEQAPAKIKEIKSAVKPKQEKTGADNQKEQQNKR
jgi:large subunit ribosomal protein L22